ncbi:MAG: hypothetical protein WCC64_16150 [Aliidongia sp.]
MSERDSFNLDDLSMPAWPQLRETESDSQPRKRREKGFVKLPLVWAGKLKGAKLIATYRLAIFLLHQNWRRRDEPITVSNVAVKEWGIQRRSKYLALQEAENLGLIKVKSKGWASPKAKLLF